MKKIKSLPFIPSSAFILSKNNVKYYEVSNKIPELGDVVYGEITRIGQHSSIENKNGRLHTIYDKFKSIFVFGNRYATDFYEGLVPNEFSENVDLLARSGLIGFAKTKNSNVKDTTQLKILGYVVNENGKVLNTKQFYEENNKFNYFDFSNIENKPKIILNIGTSMNSGKSTTSSSICRFLSSSGFTVAAAKITGTASLKDILYMQDNGASIIFDFTNFGFPSTYLLPEEDLIKIFATIYSKIINSSKKIYDYLVIEIADGILQRETSLLLLNKEFMSLVNKIIFSSMDSLGAIGGCSILKEKFNLIPDAISGICSSSPLCRNEIEEYCNIPIFENINPKKSLLTEIFLTESEKI